MSNKRDGSSVSDLIGKVSELAKRGEAGERDVAKQKLNEICMKYGVECELVDGLDERARIFKYVNNESKTILSHCIWDVVCDAEIQVDTLSKQLISVLSFTESMIIKEKYKQHWKMYLNERKVFTEQFVRDYSLGLKKS